MPTSDPTRHGTSAKLPARLRHAAHAKAAFACAGSSFSTSNRTHVRRRRLGALPSLQRWMAAGRLDKRQGVGEGKHRGLLREDSHTIEAACAVTHGGQVRKDDRRCADVAAVSPVPVQMSEGWT